MTTVVPRITDFTHVQSFAEVSEILQSTNVFLQRGHSRVEENPVTANTLIGLNGREHHARRRIENPLFRKHSLEMFETEILDRALDENVRVLRQQRADDASPLDVDLLQLVRMSLLPVTATLIGLDIDLDDHAAFARLSDYIHVFVPAAALLILEEPKPGIVDRALAANEPFKKEFFLPAWERRKQLVAEASNDGSVELPPDLLTALLLHLPDLPEDQVLREVQLYFVAATDTTTLAVGTAVEHLHAWLTEHPDDRDRLTDITFVQAAVYEAIRLHPPAHFVRTVLEDTQLGSSGRRFSAGETVVIDLYHANRDPSVFGNDAEEYRPFRSVPDRVRPWGVGFGGGAHMCIGRVLATAAGPHPNDITLDEPIGTAVRVVYRLFQYGVELIPDDPPQFREGWTQERYDRFQARLTKAEAPRPEGPS